MICLQLASWVTACVIVLITIWVTVDVIRRKHRALSRSLEEQAVDALKRYRRQRLEEAEKAFYRTFNRPPDSVYEQDGQIIARAGRLEMVYRSPGSWHPLWGNGSKLIGSLEELGRYLETFKPEQ